ncbi:molybdate ABC transporter, inner membrane subunit [Gluconacetobacter diazotrophicus PA1 5]|uniref:Molybdenum transport system permease n=2 Tax=Gluconacetobacter diazotrophicus TaxID=33996 RepID=A9H5S2_GLUDA|nr:molybdate ABC transporter permease subunit [Gluconacetobacter diazotrophicus]AAG35386.1 ModB [Gluconacetobacter diazotrophicus PA1 5]ACI51359.1 molybdate ABC transporter, inner membrane subunit [Gluconacetobacter diazotrophicus PA1 5]MBB2157396.1 molybdate ABC transporter permease subunit [Gluconacetobacter diazotrophicus]TWB09907.1 molybdate transport system permease protein [Gluconacetobacter diazotrophicus]CAP54369.1 putative molybdenum transport system permease protein modB [Gluconaceto
MSAMAPDVQQAAWLTIRLALTTTLFLMIVSLPLAWWLARPGPWWKPVLGAIISLPLVLPPSVLGYYFLIAFGPSGPGGWVARLWGGRTLAFSFPGLVVGSLLYVLPFAVQPIQNAFRAIGRRPIEVAATLGASPWRTFWTVAVPLAWPGIVTAAVLGFAHSVGEFGIVLMIGGDIPGRTRVLSVALYDYVENARWHDANMIACGMVLFSFIVIVLLSALRGEIRRTDA